MVSKASAVMAKKISKRRGPDRPGVLQECADAAGRAWADRARLELLGQGRSPCGGWPGTMSEARLQVMEAVVPEISRRGLVTTTTAEREDAARALYASARHAWLAYREPEEN